MTITQLSAYNIPMNQWTTLKGIFDFISLDGNNNIFVDPLGTQFYFDSTDEVLFVRFTTGKPLLVSETPIAPPDSVAISYNSKNYYVSLVPGGVVDSTVGRYHELIGTDSIVGLYKNQTF